MKLCRIGNFGNEKPALIGTCHAFNPKGDIVKRIWPKWHEN